MVENDDEEAVEIDNEGPTPVDDERYAHINPALLARLRARQLGDQGQMLRRSA